MIGVVVGIMISTVLYVAVGPPGGVNNRPSATFLNNNNAELTGFAYKVLGYINTGDYQALSQVAHPEYGVVFSPYATVSLTKNKCFQTDQIAAFGSDQTVYIWGVQDGIGEPIEMTAASYFSEYILDRDYINASVIGVNRIVKSGNALENITEEFPDIRFIDFHIPGGDKDSTEDLCWSSLRLGFEEYDGKLWLTLILNSKWTV